MRKPIFLAGVLGLAASAAVEGAVVTYTLSLHESPTCQPTSANQFTVWVTTSQGDNAGLFAFGVDLTGTGDPGGPTTMTLLNRSPSGSFDVDPNDPNYDPGGAYPSKFYGFGSGRATSASTGVGSGVHDLAQGSDMLPIFGYGQKAGKASDAKPPPDLSSGVPVAYGPVKPAPGSDTIWPPCTPPAGVSATSARLLTGSWTGNAPSIQTTSVNTKASVWKLNHPTNTENELATMQFLTLPGGDFIDSVSLNGPTKGANQAVGGSILVSGANGSYVSEVDQLLDPSLSVGNAPISAIGDEVGAIYVMAKLNGTAADIQAVLNALGPIVATVIDPQLAALHAIYDPQFGGGGFNALFRFPNVAGPKTFNWEFAGAHGPVTIDQLAVVPEPGIALAGVMGVMAIAVQSRRRKSRS